MNTITFEDFQKVAVRVGEIVAVEIPEGSDARLHRDDRLWAGNRPKAFECAGDELRQVGTAGHARGLRVESASKNIAGFLSEVLVLGVPGYDGKLALLSPTRKAELGGRVY